MNNEIKEILDYLQENSKKDEATKQLVDYITNLQQENEKIRKMNMHEHKYGSDMEEKYLIEKNKNDRAVEYIMSELVDEWSIKNDGYVDGSDLPVNAITPILEILNGRSDE